MHRDMREIRCEQAGESCLIVKHPSGLEIRIMEMPGFHTAHALFGTRYGSINNRFRLKGDAEYTQVPDGIAHFLEHKLFENEDCDAFAQYAKTGANANAYTSFDRTCYLFSCSENFAESLEILLSFVQAPYFTQASVDKEQGIIGQEIRMYDDEPSWQVFFNALRGMYHSHPVNIDIAGTVESIAEIDADLLYRCYNTFYNLHNMVLSVAGNVKADEVLAICDRLLKPCEDQGLEQVFPDEPYEVVTAETEAAMSVGAPMFYLGFKLRPRSGYALLKAELTAYMLMLTLLGNTSAFYQEMTEQGLLNSEFSVDTPFSGNGYFALLCGGESRDPRAVRDRILQVIEDAKVNGFDTETFELTRRTHYGAMIRSCNNVESNATNMLNAFISEMEPFESIRALSEITVADAERFLREELDTANITLSIVHNGKEA
ncbi:MAG: insulinase family protein [Oscillospiraceae bacterium]|nr:insulinase family protein [Oscillospiraceae bacterium]